MSSDPTLKFSRCVARSGSHALLPPHFPSCKVQEEPPAGAVQERPLGTSDFTAEA